jgi:addiction module RelE/StbE family toxin
MKIVRSPLALEKLSDIADYIALDKPTASLNWIENVFSEVEKLSTFPESGKIVPELKNDQYRELIIGNYRVIYKQAESEIQILTARNFKQLLSVKNLSGK